jgi:hypothetical protein
MLVDAHSGASADAGSIPAASIAPEARREAGFLLFRTDGGLQDLTLGPELLGSMELYLHATALASLTVYCSD